MIVTNQLFSVHPKNTNIHVVVWAGNRELAKEAAAKQWLEDGWGGPDNWWAIPITAPGDRVYLTGLVLST